MQGSTYTRYKIGGIHSVSKIVELIVSIRYGHAIQITSDGGQSSTKAKFKKKHQKLNAIIWKF